MEALIIAVVIIVVLILFFIWASKGGAKLQKEREDKLKRAEPGKARILGYNIIGLSGTGSHGKYQTYRFVLEVWSEYKVPYKTSSYWNVFDMGAPKVQEGNEVDVKIDADDANIVYPVVQSVEYSWTGAMISKGKEKNK